MSHPSKKVKVAILGSGNIGTDLLIKTLRSPFLECALFIGRNLSSNGMSKAIGLGVKVSDRSIDAIMDEPGCCEIVFDATSALAHKKHAQMLEKLGKIVIDLTPSNIGKRCIPAVNLEDCLECKNVSMVTCGGQASIPLAYVLGRAYPAVEYIEVISAISSRSAGPATRANLDEYIEATEKGIMEFSGCKKTKAILNLNPATPCIDMQTTLFARVRDPDMGKVMQGICDIVQKIKTYVPGYELIAPPMMENGRIVIMVRVRGRGDYLPPYAGNLDIINCAAITMAEEYAKYLSEGRLKEAGR